MKAAYTRYGPPDVVEVSDLDKPVPRDNEIHGPFVMEAIDCSSLSRSFRNATTP